MKTKTNWVLLATTATLLLSVAACDKVTPVGKIQGPVNAAKAPKPPKVGTESITPVYPDAAAASELKLDYVSFQQVDTDGVSAVPLPPYVQAKTKLHLAPNAAGFDIVAGNMSCVGPMALSVGEKEIAVLDPAKGTTTHHLAVDATAAPQGVDLAVSMTQSAGANFNCNITVRPAATQAVE